jgi:nucleoside-diphosphate-sugar epimerase
VKANKQTVIITGANGFLGSTLVTSFKRDGWQVIALVRNAHTYTTPGVNYVEFDLAKPFDTSAFAGADYMIHAAYVKYDHKHPDAFTINVEGSKRLLKASREHKLKRNIFISSMSAHAGAESTYGKQKLGIEKLFKGADCAVIRSGLIMGDGGMVKQMTDFMKSKHVVPLIGGGKQPLQVVAIYDLVRVIKAILQQKYSGTLTIATPEVYTYKTFYSKLSKQLGIKVAFIPVPLGMLMGIVKLTSSLHLPFSINEDNVLGLKNLRSAETADDLRSIHIELDNLDKILSKSGKLALL